MKNNKIEAACLLLHQQLIQDNIPHEISLWTRGGSPVLTLGLDPGQTIEGTEPIINRHYFTGKILCRDCGQAYKRSETI